MELGYHVTYLTPNRRRTMDKVYEDKYSNGRLRFRKNYKNGYWDGLYEEWDFLGNLVECCPDKIRVNF